MTRRQQKIIGGLSAFGVVIIAIVLFLILPLQNKILDLNTALSQERINTAAAEEQRQSSQVRQLEYERLNESAQALDSFFVSEKEILTFISSIEQVAERYQIRQEIQSLQPPEVGVKQTQLSLISDGTFNEIRQYLADLESMDTFLLINKLSFQPSGTNTGETTQIRLTIEATLEWL